jgi:N-acetylneuraminate synthase
MFIAEIGINHNGSLQIALELIRAAKDAGADCVKFQMRDPELCFTEEQKNEVKNTIFGEMKYIEYKKLLELRECAYDQIDAYCREIHMSWSASVWDRNSLKLLMKYNPPFIKVPSARTLDYDLLDDVNKCRKPVVISMGATTEHAMKNALNHLHSVRDYTTILHCNSSYPSSIDELDLSYIPKLRCMFPDNIIGYSGHERGFLPTLIARAMGAVVIERHITLDKTMPGSDHKASLDIGELKQLIPALKEVDIMMGDPVKRIYPSEEAVMQKLRLE